METNRPKGLIQNKRLIPKQTEEQTIAPAIPKVRKFNNQTQNIKVSSQTKDQLDILMKLTDNKFMYEMIETLIDSYTENILDPDKKRAFKSLTSL